VAPTAWICRVCGHIHYGDSPPDECPVCGAPAEDFDPYVEPAPPAPSLAAGLWRCPICGYTTDAAGPPDECPTCGAARDLFEREGAAEHPAAPTPRRDGRRILIIGGGIAALSAAESVRSADPTADITLATREHEPPYYRLNLTRYLAGEVARESLRMRSLGWYDSAGISLWLDAEASSIDLVERVVRFHDGRAATYDRVVLATGAHAFVPPIPGADRTGVRVLRTIEDADWLLERAAPGARIVCIGGGILGLETAGALARRGCEVTLLESFDWLLPRQLNRQASINLQARVESIGVRVLLRASTAEITIGDSSGGVQLDDGRFEPADVVTITTGVRSNTHLARRAGIATDRGILVDDAMRTSAADVYAAGDAVEHRGSLYGLWMPAKLQGAVAGANAAGRDDSFTGVPRSNTLKVLGVDMLSIGEFEPADGSYVVIDGERDGAYLRFVFHDSRLVGSVMVGDVSAAQAAKRAVESGVEMTELLRATPSADDVARHLTEAGGQG